VRLVEGLVALDSGRFADARDLLADLGGATGAPPAVRRAADCGVAMVAKGLLDIPTALATGQAALHQARKAGDTEAARDLMLMLGEASVYIGDIDGASSWFDQAEDALLDLPRGERTARLLMGRVIVARARRDLDRARTLADQAVDILEQLGRRRRLAQVLNTKGDLLRYAGDLEGATRAYQRTEQLFSSLGTAYATVPRINLGLTLLALERFEAAGTVLRRTLGEVRAQGHPGYAYAVRHGLLPVAAAVRDRDGFREHLAAIERLRDKGHFIDSDLAVAAEQAGDLWHRAWERSYASRAWNLALVQWEGLKQQEAAQRVRRKLGR
jgi:tetratricopeptide (TPR) repeat protein